jgi:hypothetical protein
MLISQTIAATTSSVRLRLPAFPQGSRFGASIEGRPMTAGTSAPSYGVRVPAFVKGDAVVAVRAWRPPV